MGHLSWIVPTALLGLLAAGYFATRRILAERRLNKFRQARETFRRRREWLEVDFLTAASQSGMPRGLSWSSCEFDDDIAFARDRRNGDLRALVGVTVSFEAVVGGDMEGVEAVGNKRAATAVFRYEEHTWKTDGRAIFNLDPIQTIQHFQHELERLSS